MKCLSQISRQILIPTILLLGIPIALANVARGATDNEVRVYWNAELSEIIVNPAAGDTITAYIVLQPLQNDQYLTKCSFSLFFAAATVVDFDSPLGELNKDGLAKYILTLAEPAPLADKMVLATVRAIIPTLDPDRILISGCRYETEQSVNLAVRPFRYADECAWINPGEPQGYVNPPELEFGIHGTGTSTISAAYLVNYGSGPIFLTPDVISTCGDFGIHSPADLDVIGVGRSVRTEFEFMPQAIGPRLCQLNLGPGLDVALQGTGREPIHLLAWPDSLDFGTLLLGDEFTMACSVDNEGDFPEDVYVIFPEPCGNFRSLDPDPRVLLPGRGFAFHLVFRPETVGRHECIVSYQDSLMAIKLVGVGEIAQSRYRIIPEVVKFELTRPNEPVAASFLVENSGYFPYFPDAQLIDPAGAFLLRQIPPVEEILPGETAQFDLNFLPKSPGSYTAWVALGDSLPNVELFGVCADTVYRLRLDPPVLWFDPSNPGESDTQSFTVTNIDLVPMDIEPWTASSLVSGLDTATTLAPGESQVFTATYAPLEYGQFTFRIILNPAYDLAIECVGPPRFEFASDQNRVGFFFDTEFTANHQTISPTPQFVTAYLAMFNPSNESGIAGWECRIETSAGATLVGYDLAGTSLDLDPDPFEFVVGMGLEPLPYNPVTLLGTFEFLVDDMSVESVAISAGPVAGPSVPGLMAWVPWDDFNNLIPLVPTTDGPELAWMHWDISVGTATPSPTCLVQGSGISVSWPNRAPAGGGYHVYRRLDGEPRQRLTTVPLTSESATISFWDPAEEVSRGEILNYSYRLVVASTEVAQSPEVEVAHTGGIPLVTRLLRNVPNPFNPETTIHYELGRASQVRLSIYDVTGRRVRVLVDAERPAGAYRPVWNGRDKFGRPLPSGTYYVRLVTDRIIDRQKILLVK